jgi:hypothetical protein
MRPELRNGLNVIAMMYLVRTAPLKKKQMFFLG